MHVCMCGCVFERACMCAFVCMRILICLCAFVFMRVYILSLSLSHSLSSSWEEDSESSMSPLYPIASAEDLYWGRPSDSQTRIVPFASVARLLILPARKACASGVPAATCASGGEGNALPINTRKDDVRTASVAMCPTRTREEACVKRCDTQRGQKKGGSVLTLVRVREARFCA